MNPQTKFKKEINSSKWQHKTDGQMYSLTLADSDLPLYQPFHEKLIQKIKEINNFTYKNRSSDYYNSIINWYKKHHLTNENQNIIKPQMFVQCPSICNLVGSSILALTSPNDYILLMTPVYTFYITAILELKRKIISNPLKQLKINANNLYTLEFDPKDFEHKMALYKPKMIILCHPHNPTGKIFTKQELDFIVGKAQQYSTYIVSDQIMGDFAIFNKNQNLPKFHSLINYSYEKIIIGNSLSKVFNLESIQCGYGIIRNAEVRNLYNLISYRAFKHLTNQMGLLMTPIVYSEQGQNWIRYANKIIKQNNNLLLKTFEKQSDLRLFQLESSFLTIMEFNFQEQQFFKNKRTNDLNNSYFREALEQKGIFFLDIRSYFYPLQSRNIFRLSIALEPQIFQKFILKFKNILAQTKKQALRLGSDLEKEQLRKSKL